MPKVEGYLYSIIKDIIPIIQSVPFNDELMQDFLHSRVLHLWTSKTPNMLYYKNNINIKTIYFYIYRLRICK